MRTCAPQSSSGSWSAPPDLVLWKLSYCSRQCDKRDRCKRGPYALSSDSNVVVVSMPIHAFVTLPRSKFKDPFYTDPFYIPWIVLHVTFLELFTLLDLRVASLRRGHANILCIVPIWTDDPRKESIFPGLFCHTTAGDSARRLMVPSASVSMMSMHSFWYSSL